MSTYYTRTLTQVQDQLRQSPLLPPAVKYIRSHAAAINVELGEAVVSAIPAFTESRNPDVQPALARHGPQHTEEILRLLGGGRVGDFEFVREHARRRADSRFPLEATLHAYRCGHKVFSRWLRKAILAATPPDDDAQQMVAAVADFALEYTDAISTIAASSYVAQTRLLADVAGARRAELINILLDGYDESDGRVAAILKSAGYLDRRQSFCVAIAQPVDPSEMLNPLRARRVADSIDEIVRGSVARRVIDIRDNRVVTIFSDTRRVSGWTAPNAKLATRLNKELMLVGNAVLIGVSNDVPATALIPNAHRQALLALELASVSDRVVQFSEISARRLMLHIAGDELQQVTPPWVSEFVRLDEKLCGALLATVRAYADADMNVLKTAEALSVHPNTVYSRFQKLLDATGLDVRSYHALTELLIVADCARH